jgi:hypothetical protein
VSTSAMSTPSGRHRVDSVQVVPAEAGAHDRGCHCRDRGDLANGSSRPRRTSSSGSKTSNWRTVRSVRTRPSDYRCRDRADCLLRSRDAATGIAVALRRAAGIARTTSASTCARARSTSKPASSRCCATS